MSVQSSTPSDLIRSDMRVIAYVALGSNLGDSPLILSKAIKELSEKPGLKLLSCSALYASKPIDATGDDYVNAVIALECFLNPVDLLRLTQELELAYGRVRSFVNAPRTLDLDLILYGHAQVTTPRLVIPHPRWTQRAFVLRPLQSIAPHLVSEEMLSAVKDQEIELLQPSL